MGDLFRTIASFGAGTTEFSLVAWAIMGITLAAYGVLMVTLGRPLTEPVVVLLAVRRSRAVLWTGIALVASPIVTTFFVATVIGIPFAVVWLLFVALATMTGYVAVAWTIGDVLTRRIDRPDLHPLVAFAIGFVLMRLVRLIPYVGGPVMFVVTLVGLGAAMAVSWDLVWSWHKRRLPDNVQFKDEPNLIEWHAPEEPRPGE